MGILDAKNADPLRQAFEDKKLRDYFTKENLKRSGKFLGETAARTTDDIVGLVNMLANMNPLTKLATSPTKRGLEALGIDPDAPLKDIYAGQKGEEARLSEGLSLYTDPLLFYAPVKSGAQSIMRKLPDVVSDIKYKDPTFSATRGKLPKATAGVGADVTSTYDRAVAEQLKKINDPKIRTMPVERSLVRSDNKKIFEYLDNLKKTGEPLSKRKLLRDLDLSSGSKGTITAIVEKFYPNTFAKLTDEQIKKVQSERMMEVFETRRAEETVTEPIARRLRTGQGDDSITQVDFPNEKMKKNYIADLTDIYNNIKTNGSNTKLAEKYFGEATSLTVRKVERINEFFIKELNLIKPIADPSASGKLRTARINAAEKFLSPEELEIVKRQNRQITIANKYYAANPEEILNNPTFMKLLNAKLVNGKIVMKDPITLEKAKELTKKGLFDIFHVSPVSSEKRNIMFPSNILVSPGRINQGFNNAVEAYFKKTKNSTDPEIIKNKQAISNFYEEFGLTFETVDGRIGAKMLPAIDRETNKLTSIDNVFEKMKVPQIIDSSRYVSRQELDKIDFKDVLGEFVPLGSKIPETYKRKDFKEGGRVGFVTGGLSESIKEVQEDIKQRTEPLRETISDIAEPYAIKTKEVLDDTAKVLNKNERPAQFRVVQDGYKLVTESPILKSLVALPATSQIAGLETIEAIYNKIRPGVENDIEMEEKFPAIYGLQRYLTQSVGKTPDDQTYISVVDEINKAQETGFTRLGFNIADFIASITDGVTNKTEFTEKVREAYDKSIKEGRFTEPETFLGEVGAIAVEFGAPGGAAFKTVNAGRRMLGSMTGLNLFNTPTYSLKGGKWLATKISNIAKRAGTSATVFGATDIIAGGPYNTVSKAFGDDPLLFDESLGYDFEDTTGLSGKELAIANFKNRLRFGADGAIIGGLFPLVGPPLWLLTKYGAIKPITGLTKGTLRVGNELAVKPLTYLATGTLKVPLSKPGVLEAQVPLLGEAAQGVGSGVKIFADFLGKDVITRATVAVMGAKPGLIKQLPDFKDWRMFDVNSDDPLKRNLKKIDNVFAFFREAGARSGNQLYLDVKAQNFVKGKQRQIEKLIDSIERKSYDLANGFLRKYNTAGTSPAGQDYLLDQTLAYLKGQIKLKQLEPEIQEAAKALNDEFVQIRTLFRDVLPEGSGLRDFLTSNLRTYMRQSFGVFTNPQFKPDPELVEKAAQFIKGRIESNESLVELALRASNKPTDDAILDFAKKQVQDLLATAKSEGFDPLVQLQRIARENLKMDDLVLQTGEELPAVIRKLLGEEKSLRSSVLQTTSSLLTQATNLKNYDRIGELLLKEGRLFASRDEAIAAGVINPLVVGRVPGLGLLESGITNLYGSREITDVLRGSGGMLDKFMQNSIYQSMIAYKAGVQTGKTVLSPATQSRNFLSAGGFVLNNGWIGGKASVTDAFKIVMDDVFGAGRTLNEVDLINNIARKSELGVIDENIVASELTAVLSDIKNGKIGTIAQLTTRADDSALMKTATRLYSGGDNVWKWYGHEYLMSQLKGAFKNVDEVKRAVLDDFGIDVFNPKNLSEAVEEYAALLVRELMPTYSKVPPVIQAIRKIPFFGNFVSFPAEILRTSVQTSSLAMKHIASDNPTLRAMGLRSLLGQGLTLFALNEGAKALGHAFTNVTPEQIKVYKEEFGPAFMKFSELIPISNIDEDKGTFKVFDMSRFNPYDLVTATANNLFVRATDPQATLDPDKIETDVFKSYLEASGPMLDLLNETLLGFSIGFEGVAEIFEGRTKQGSPIYSGSDRDIDKFDKAISHLLKKDEPGIMSTGRRILDALKQDVTGTGQVIKLGDEGFKLAGGSAVTIDVPGSFAYKISEFKNTFKEPKVAEGFYSTKNYQQRGPAQLAREYNQQNEEAFREQYRFYRAARSALDSGLMTRSQVISALSARDLSGETIQSILSGRFVPLSYGRDALIGRYNKIKSGQPGKKFSVSDFVPIGALEKVKNKWRQFKFEDFERIRKEPEQTSSLPQVEAPVEEKIATPQLPATPDPAPPMPQTADVMPATGLTQSETALLSPSEQIIRQRQRGIV